MSRQEEILDMFASSPIVAAVKSDELLEAAIASTSSIVFVLYGSLLTISDEVERIKRAGKIAIVHVDLVQGLGKDPVGVDFVRRETRSDGIISTKQPLVRRAHELGFISGQRTFIVDSMALENTKSQLRSFRPDFLEVMPGLLTAVTSELNQVSNVPLVAGGLIRSKKEILEALNCGSCAISTTKPELWSL